jgi:protein-export membrane protein SecD
MAKKLNFSYIVAILLAIWIAFLALPQSWKMWAPGFLRSPELHLGLDLVGGTQLDFRISEEEIRKELADLDSRIAALEKDGSATDELNKTRFERNAVAEQQKNLVEAIRTVLERRINALGVSEATITPSFVGDERHLLVECPGVVDTQKCIQVVGKTIQLEFKEEFQEATEAYKKEIAAKAATAYARVQKGSSLQSVGQDMSSDLGVSYRDQFITFRDELPKGLESIWSQKVGTVIRHEGTAKATAQNSDGTVTTKDISGIYLVEVLSPLTQTGRIINEAASAFAHLEKTVPNLKANAFENMKLNASVPSRVSDALKTMQPGALQTVTMDDGSARVLFLSQKIAGQEQVTASHILVSFKGAAAAGPNVTRTKEEAAKRILELKKQLDAGANFAALARSASDGPSAQQGGSLGSITRGTMPPSFDDVVFKLGAGKISPPVETQFGYHIIRADSAPALQPDTVSYNELIITGADAPAKAKQIVSDLQSGKVRSTEPAMGLRTLFFSYDPTGWKDTELDGKHFRTAAVSLDPVTNIPVVQITFDNEGAKLFQELTRKNIGKRIAIFVGGELVSAPTVQAEISGGTAVITGSKSVQEARDLAQDLNTGAIPAPIYLVGQYTVEATLGAAALHTSLLAALIGTIILMGYMIFVYRGLGVVADVALFAYAVIFFALLKLPLLLVTKNYVVLTLAGMAGIILSIGIAVDANVLVFERMKEELRKGRPFKSALESSFKYAWPAIRDSNIASIITCAILFLIGSSIVRGFAVTLGMGVLLSLFSAVYVTRWLLRKLASMPISNNTSMFVAVPKENLSPNPLS